MAFLSRKSRRSLFVGTLVLSFVLGMQVVSARTIVTLVPFGNKKATNRPIDTVVIHATYNPALTKQTFKGAFALWKTERTVAHYAIDEGGQVYQLVPEANIAYHAGNSRLPNGEGDLNTRSIGIELTYHRFASPTNAQYTALEKLLSTIRKRRPIKYVYGHNEIAPDRKIDPWNFDWSKVTRPQGITPRPSFESTIAPLSDEQKRSMDGLSWTSACPVGLDDLRTVSVSYRGFDGKDHADGRIVVHKDVATAVQGIFRKLYLASFPIRKIVPVEAFRADDTLVMQADNSSGFNCRQVTGGATYSEHAYGRAIDINPRENPFVDPKQPLIQGGIERDVMLAGTIVKGDAAYKAFTEAGWKWGGLWKSKQDYQHFSTTGK